MLWRRFLVRSDSSLGDLCVLLQIGFDWRTSFSIAFASARKNYAVPLEPSVLRR